MQVEIVQFGGQQPARNHFAEQCNFYIHCNENIKQQANKLLEWRVSRCSGEAETLKYGTGILKIKSNVVCA